MKWMVRWICLSICIQSNYITVLDVTGALMIGCPSSNCIEPYEILNDEQRKLYDLSHDCIMDHFQADLCYIENPPQLRVNVDR
jgi:hypothetical protein